MIIHYKDDFNLLKINYRIPLKYSDEYTYQPITMDKTKPLVIQTPSLFVPFGIKDIDGKKRIDISFQNKVNDKYNEKLLNDLHLLYNKIKDKYINYEINPFIYLSPYEECMKLKVHDNIKSFNNFKTEINIIKPYSYCSFLINLSGLWILKDEIFFDWKLLQIRTDEPLYYKTYQFLPDNKIPKPPPPAPPLPNFNNKKKYIRKEKSHKKQKNLNFIAPNITDIKQALNKLKSVNIDL